MGNDLKRLVEILVSDEGTGLPELAMVPGTEVVESDSEEAWNDFQDSQLAFEKAFQNSKPGPV
jgi:hypothetical protein